MTGQIEPAADFDWREERAYDAAGFAGLASPWQRSRGVGDVAPICAVGDTVPPRVGAGTVDTGSSGISYRRIARDVRLTRGRT
jgi:hypothetical protein